MNSVMKSVYDALSLHHQAAGQREGRLTLAPLNKRSERDERRGKLPVKRKVPGLG